MEWFVSRCRHPHPLPPTDPDASIRSTPEAEAPRISPEPDPWWQSVPDALAWIVGLLIEGFAAYGASMHPGFFEPLGMDAVGRREVAETSWSGHFDLPQRHGETSYSDQWLDTVLYEVRRTDVPPQGNPNCAVTYAAVDPGTAFGADARPRLFSSWRASLVTRFANVGLTTRRWRTATAELPELDTLDDRTLRDIGISPCEIGYCTRLGGGHGWHDRDLATWRTRFW